MLNGDTQLRIHDINRLPPAEFVSALGGIFEKSPWVAEAALDLRPFDNRTALHAAMAEAVRSASRERQSALLKAHPELAGAAARAKSLTASSTEEQASAGLDRLDDTEQRDFETGNARYLAQNGFPFIIAVKGQRDQTAILAALHRRLQNPPDIEFATALDEVYKIARFRLDALIAPAGRLTIHVLDTNLGRPASGLAFALYRLDEQEPVISGTTNQDGRYAEGPLLQGDALRPGQYEMRYAVGAYQRALGMAETELFYDMIPIRFTIHDADAHYHVPLILARYGYSTYRGS
jgi:2-oxo-4-hydroxy-4-carboxy-5-ureidoimidazoline decarboxylase